MTMKFAKPGSVSTGTLRTPDLLEAFAWKAMSLLASDVTKITKAPVQWEEHDDLCRHALHLVAHWRDEGRELPEDEDAQETLDALMGLLDEYAPAGHMFGAHPGDGADFGYWPEEE